ncbi:MAG: GrdX family protein [Bacillota bacterium]|nr:GrdX family protein [Bacillota bacterium]
MNSYILITNNPLVKKNLIGKDIFFTNKSLLGVLIECRNHIHKGHRLLSHPLSSSVKPNETPFKSVLISKSASNLDYRSLEIIESSILSSKKFISDAPQPKWPDKILDDFMLIDYSVISNTIDSIK